MPVQPYLMFGGRCEEALAFYGAALGAEIGEMMRFSEMPATEGPARPMPPGYETKVMHCSFTVHGSTIMASDGDCQGDAKVENCSLAITGIDVATADRLYGALADGGTTPMPIGTTFFSPRFGMVTDRFGVTWMVVADA